MGSTFPWILIFAVVALSIVPQSKAEDPYKYYTWTVTYGNASPLGTPQQVILINGAFPGPRLDVVTNDNIVIDVINQLDDPFLLTWNGIKQRKNSWEDGVLGTNCPIPPNSNFTYKFQTKDQIGTYTYFPSTGLHKAAGGYGALNVYARTGIPVPYAKPADDVTLLIGDWFKASHKVLQERLDSGSFLPLPNGIIINGQQQTYFTGDQGKTYMFRISNVGLRTSFNFRIEGHTMKVVELEGSHIMQNYYQSLDVHVGQSVAFLVTLDQPQKDYYMVASTRFTRRVLSASAILHYSSSTTQVNGTLPPAPVFGKSFSVEQARTFRWNLSSNAARPNIQGSFHYGKIAINRTFVFANSLTQINGKLRCAVNGVSHVNPATPLKLADYYNISGVFSTGSIQDVPSDGPARLDAAVVKTDYHAFVEIVFQNSERSLQSWHLDGYDFWVVGFGNEKWTSASRSKYNLVDATTRHTVQVYPRMWTAILVSLDNQGMWNVRSAGWERQYLGQQFYLQVYTPEKSFSNEYSIPTNALLCGKAVGQKLLL